MNPHAIKTLLLSRGYKPSDVANAIGVSRTTMHGVIHGTGKSRRVASAIAKLLNRSIDDLFPGQYPDAAERAARIERKITALRQQLQQMAG